MFKLAINGIPRSGSTLTGQLLRGVLETIDPGYILIRSHPGVGIREEVDHTFITLRHPYDVAASRYRVRLSRDPNTGGLQGLKAEISVMAQHYAGLQSLYQLPHTVLRYEKFYNDYEVIYDSIETALGIRIQSIVKADLNIRYSLDSNRVRANKLENFLVHDDELIHGDHIGGVHPGSWKNTLPQELQSPMLDLCQGIAEEHGYA